MYQLHSRERVVTENNKTAASYDKSAGSFATATLYRVPIDNSAFKDDTQLTLHFGFM